MINKFFVLNESYNPFIFIISIQTYPKAKFYRMNHDISEFKILNEIVIRESSVPIHCSKFHHGIFGKNSFKSFQLGIYVKNPENQKKNFKKSKKFQSRVLRFETVSYTHLTLPTKA